jgi:hypothetical protein
MLKSEPHLTDENYETVKSDYIRLLGTDRVLAHAVLFKHRHPNLTPPFHRSILDLWHSRASRVLVMAFRGAAKSTLSEESMLLSALFKDFKNGVILGETYERAVERLTSIKHELETNPYIEDLFGWQVGEIWQEGRIVLQNGVMVQAFGRGQSLRGSKYLDQRPDMVFGDDMENDEAALTPEARAKTRAWFWGVVIPALDPVHMIRVAATPLDADALPNSLQAHANFQTLKVPIYAYGVDGEMVPAWPDRFPLQKIEELRKEFYRLGLSYKWQQEYMCEAEDPQTKAFTSDLFKVRPQIKTWQATWAFYDPARTVKSTSSTTGVAIWSWISSRLVVWDAYGKLWKPDEIIQDIFKVNEIYSPVAVGIEPDGLEEFIMQPLRQAQLKYGEVVPFRPIRAPRSKLDFIRGLQPFFKAGEVTFAKELPDLVEQLLSFPTGRIDVPNALAYAVRMRPGLPVYEDFDPDIHIEEVRARTSSRVYVAWNATKTCTSAVLFQFLDGALHVFKDWLREGEPVQTVRYISSEISLEIGKMEIKHYVGAEHYRVGDAIGLRAALRAAGCDSTMAGDSVRGRAALQDLLRTAPRGHSGVLVSTSARWTLNALSGGYARGLDRKGVLTAEPDDTVYKSLMNGLESVLSFVGGHSEIEGAHYDYTEDGRRYLSARA